MPRVRVHRLEPAEPLPLGRPFTRPSPNLAARAAAGNQLDLGSRIGLAADVQSTAGNAAMAHLAGFVRTDHKGQPPKGVQDIQEAAKSPGNRGLTQSKYTANPPIFRIGKTEQVNGTWEVRPAQVKLPSLDYEVWWPAPGRHLIGPYGKGNRYLDVTEEWSNLLQKGEEEHVTDTDTAWEMTWGRVAGIINAFAAGKPCTGSTAEAAQQAAWVAFVGKLPAGFKPAGERATTEAQEALWGADDTKTIFRKLMNETKAKRDGQGWHLPDESQKATVGDDLINELSKGNSKIGDTTTEKLIGDAWKRLTTGT